MKLKFNFGTVFTLWFIGKEIMQESDTRVAGFTPIWASFRDHCGYELYDDVDPSDMLPKQYIYLTKEFILTSMGIRTWIQLQGNIKL